MKLRRVILPAKVMCKIRSIIPKMLFGTSFKREQKAKIQDLLDWSAQEPVQIMDAIDAMDRFAESTGAAVTHHFRVQYACLCEYAHPTMGSTRGFFDVVEENPNGWVLKYKYDEKVQQDDVKAALTMTIDSMRAGYGNVLILINGKFADSAHGIVYNPPPTEFGNGFWTISCKGTRTSPIIEWLPNNRLEADARRAGQSYVRRLRRHSGLAEECP